MEMRGGIGGGDKVGYDGCEKDLGEARLGLDVGIRHHLGRVAPQLLLRERSRRRGHAQQVA